MWMNRYNKSLLNDDWFNDFDMPQSNCLQPRTDLEKNENDYRLYIELPGITKDDIRIEVEDSVLKISGEKKNPAGEKMESLSQERCYGKFSRAFRLGREIDNENIQVNLTDGLLQIVLPRRNESRKQNITIN